MFASKGPVSARAYNNAKCTLNPQKHWQLFDVVADRTESVDLAAKEPARVRDLSAAYAAWAKALGRRQAGQKGKKGEDSGNEVEIASPLERGRPARTGRQS